MDLHLKIGKIAEDQKVNDIRALEKAYAIREGMKKLKPSKLCRQCHSFYFDLTPSRIIQKIKGELYSVGF